MNSITFDAPKIAGSDGHFSAGRTSFLPGTLRDKPWKEMAVLYDQLVTLDPTVGALVGRAVAHSFAYGAETGLEQLSALDQSVVRIYQPWWVARSHMLRLLGDESQSRVCLQTALELTTYPKLRRFLESQLVDPS